MARVGFGSSKKEDSESRNELNEEVQQVEPRDNGLTRATAPAPLVLAQEEQRLVDQQAGLAALDQQKQNSSALLSNIQKTKKESSQSGPNEQSLEATRKNYGKAQSFLGQNLPVPQQRATAWASGDNYSSSKLNRKQLRQETRNDAYFVPQTDSDEKRDEGLQASEFTPREGWEYVRSEDGCTHGLAGGRKAPFERMGCNWKARKC